MQARTKFALMKALKRDRLLYMFMGLVFCITMGHPALHDGRIAVAALNLWCWTNMWPRYKYFHQIYEVESIETSPGQFNLEIGHRDAFVRRFDDPRQKLPDGVELVLRNQPLTWEDDSKVHRTPDAIYRIVDKDAAYQKAYLFNDGVVAVMTVQSLAEHTSAMVHEHWNYGDWVGRGIPVTLMFTGSLSFKTETS